MFKNKYIKIRAIVMICSGFPSIQNYVLIDEKIYQLFIYSVIMGQLTIKQKRQSSGKREIEKVKGKISMLAKKNRNCISRKLKV